MIYHSLHLKITTEIFSGSSSGISLDSDSKNVNKHAVFEADGLETLDHESVQQDISGDIIDDGLRRGLKGRYFVLISLGSIIGPGCFWGLGYAMYLSGPLGSLLGFAIVGKLVDNRGAFKYFETNLCRFCRVGINAEPW